MSSRSGQDCRDADEAGSSAICACARYGAAPRNSEHPCFEASGGGVRRSRMSDLTNGDAHFLFTKANGYGRQLTQCVRPLLLARQRGQKSSSGCEKRSNVPDNGNQVSPSRSNGNDTNNPNKSGNLDAERSARMAVRRLPGAVHLRRA